MKTIHRSLSLAVLAFCFVFTARAQQVRVAPETARPAAWTQFVGDQLAASLASPSAAIRMQALEHLIVFAHTFGDELDLRAAVPALVQIYRQDPDEQSRLAAVVGLHALGDDGGLQQVRLGLVREPSNRVQHIAIAALADHYGLGTFEGSEDIAALARHLADYHTQPRELLPYIASEQ